MNWITPFTLAPGDRLHTRIVHTALVRDLYRRNRVPVLIHLAFLGFLYLVLREQLAAPGWLRWLGSALALAALGRVVLVFRGAQLEPAMRRPNPRFALFTGAAAGFGLLLGGVVLAALPHLYPGRFLLLTLCLVGLYSLACITMAGSPSSYGATMIPALGSLALAGFLRPPPGMGYLFSVAMLGYMCALMATAFQVHHSLFEHPGADPAPGGPGPAGPPHGSAQPPLPAGVHAGGDAPGAAPVAEPGRRRDR
jgi:hypothetical protein